MADTTHVSVMMIPDLSHYNEEIDWDIAEQQTPFAIMRATVGVNRDKRYWEFAAACKSRNIPFHAYHYLKALTTEEAIREAGVFYCATVQYEPLFYIIDCEYDEISKATVEKPGLARTIVDAFEAELRRLARTDIQVACYIGGNNYTKWDLDYEHYAYVWIPRYGEDDGMPHTPPKYPCDLWQYTSNGQVDYVSDDVDLNQLTGRKPVEYFTDQLHLQLGDRVLTHGCVGDDVAALQKELCEHGYELGTYGANRDGIDGEYGAMTEDAVAIFQRKHGLAETGVCDEFF